GAVGFTIVEGADPGAFVGEEADDDGVERGLDFAVPLWVGFFDDLGFEVAFDEAVGAAGEGGHGGVQPLEVFAHTFGGGDVESLLFGDVGGVDASGDVVCAEPVPPFGVGDTVDEGHGDGGAAVASFNAGDLVVGVGARLASLAVAGFFGSAEFPGDFEVGGGDGGAVVPVGFGADLELVGEGGFVDELGFLGKEVQVGGEGGAVRLPVAGVRQDAVEHLEGVDASPFW